MRLFTQQQQDQQLQVHLRSNHPSVQFRVGQYVLLTRPGAAPKTGFVLSWSVAEEPESRTTHAGWIAGGPAAAAASVVASAIAAVGGEPSSQVGDFASAAPSQVCCVGLAFAESISRSLSGMLRFIFCSVMF